MEKVLDLNPETYVRHDFHTLERDWAETNCYVDVWIEQLHALGLNPTAGLAYTITADFEDRLKSYRLLSEAYNLN